MIMTNLNLETETKNKVSLEMIDNIENCGQEFELKLLLYTSVYKNMTGNIELLQNVVKIEPVAIKSADKDSKLSIHMNVANRIKETNESYLNNVIQRPKIRKSYKKWLRHKCKKIIC